MTTSPKIIWNLFNINKEILWPSQKKLNCNLIENVSSPPFLNPLLYHLSRDQLRNWYLTGGGRFFCPECRGNFSSSWESSDLKIKFAKQIKYIPLPRLTLVKHLSIEATNKSLKLRGNRGGAGGQTANTFSPHLQFYRQIFLKIFTILNWNVECFNTRSLTVRVRNPRDQEFIASWFQWTTLYCV